MAIVTFLQRDAIFAAEIDEPAFVAARKEGLSLKGPRNENGF